MEHKGGANMLKSFMKLTDSVLRIGKMKDSITTGLLGGLIGTIFMDASNMLLYKAKITEATYGHASAQLFVAPFRTKQRKNWILGELLHLAVGSVSGIPLLYLLKKTGKDHYLSKGLVSSYVNLGYFLYWWTKNWFIQRATLYKDSLFFIMEQSYLWVEFFDSFSFVS